MIASADGILALRFANAAILPFDVGRYATDTRTHVQTLVEVADQRRVDAELSALVGSTEGLERAAGAFEAARSSRLNRGSLPAPEASAINRALIGLEKAWLNDEGLQDRRWSRSLYVSPDPFSGYASCSGYASWMLPGIRYEIETDDPAGVPEWEAEYIAAIDDLTQRIEAVTALMGGPEG